ncbi:MAG: T9SS type A sorting domain-containing protein [candidate division Zixibacteria bacterium]|nr:T9SS type A sorting domain-containing protein [candidate division Zixibacteria bacterium]
MLRSAYILLVMSLFIVVLASSVLADKGDDESLALFFDPTTENEVTGPPPNYQEIDPTYFFGAPPFEIIDRYEIGGYNVYFDTASELWTISSIMYTGGIVYEQLHGSVLIQLDPGLTPEMVVQPIGFTVTEDLMKNDRWGYVKYSDNIAENLYEIWWDITIDYARLEDSSDVFDTIGIAFSGCAFDFNLWASGNNTPFDADQLRTGKKRIPISYIPNFTDTYTGITDASQTTSISSANLSTYTPSDLPGATFNADGLISADKEFSGSYVYEGNGIQFSIMSCPPNSNNPPYFYWPSGTSRTVNFCTPELIYDTIKILDPDQDDTLTLTKISGPGDFVSNPGPSPVRGYYSWTPVEAGTYVIVFEGSDTQGHVITDSLTYIVTLDNNPPIANDTDTTFAVCGDQISGCVFVDASDPDGNTLTYRLIGDKTNVTLDENTGELCLETYVSGTYSYQVEVSDACASDTATVTFNVTGNNNPYINAFDSTVYLCTADTICFDVTASDPDDGDSLIITNITGPGIFSQTGNGSGRQCFLPDNVDSARYVFTYQVTDDCLRGELATKCPKDSIVITVIMGTKPQITCPDGPLTYNLCNPDTICIPITIEPSDADVTILEPGAVYKDGKLCFYADQSGTYTYTVVASGECGSDTCVVTFNVSIGTPPEITCPTGDIAVGLCEADSICVNLPISPANADVIILESGAVYENGKLCFYADQSGTFTYTVVASGECGSDTCVVTFDVTIGTPPEITCPTGDIAVGLCKADSICFNLPISPANADVIILEPGAVYENGKLCFYADQSGTFTYTVIASGECGSDTCVVTFDVEIGTPPSITCPTEDLTVNLCEADSVCIDLPVSPSNANIMILESGAVYENGRLCFYAETAGYYIYTVVASGECGDDTCVVTFNVTIGNPPTLTCPDNQTIHLCGPGNVTVPLGLLPPTAEIFIIPQADYVDGNLTFFADTAGTYCFNVTASTECGEDECDFCIAVTFDSPPIVNIEGGSFFQCAPEEICLPVTYSDPDGNIASVTVEPSGYEIINGQVCFTPAQTDSYRFIVMVTDDCGNSVSDTAYANVEINVSPTVSIGDTTLFLCEASEVCLPVSFSDADGLITTINVSSPGYYNSDNNTVCMTVDETGEFLLTITVTDSCGVAAEATGTINAAINRPPYITGPSDTAIFACTPGEICLTGFDYGDPDGNITDVSFIPDLGTFENGTFCFTPPTEGEYCFVAQVTDECGSVAVDTFCVTYTAGEDVVITCPGEVQFFDLCAPSNLCVPITFEPSDAQITIRETGGIYENGELCFYAETSGEYSFTVVAEGECGIDSCEVVFSVTIGDPPAIACPTPEPVHLCAPDSIHIPISILPPDAQLTIRPDGSFANGVMSFYADVADNYCFEIIAENDCGVDTCHFCIDVTFDAPPIVEVPDTTLALCEATEICIPISYSDPDNNIFSVEVIPNTYQISNGNICFTPSGTGSYQFIVVVTDSCGNIAADTSDIELILNQLPTVAIEDTTIFVCGETHVCLPLAFSDPDGIIDSITVSPPAYFDSAMANVCVPISEAGEVLTTVTVYDDCGASATDGAVITATANTTPIVSLGAYDGELCELETVCVPISVMDADNNVVDISIEGDCASGDFNAEDSTICVTLTEFGSCQLTVIATDVCGAADTATTTININYIPMANAQCPGDTSIFLCEPGQVCIEFGELVLGTNIRILPETVIYYPELNRMCYFAESDAVDTFTIIDSTICGVDSCQFVVTVLINDVPVVAAEEPEELVFCDSATLCINVSITDADNNIELIVIDGNCPEAVYDAIAGTVCMAITQETHCSLEIIAVDSCGKSNRLILPINAVPNTPPVISLPYIETIVRCVTDTDPISIADICVTDRNIDEVTLVLDSGLGEFSYNSHTSCGILEFTPPSNDSAEYCFRFMAYDYCDTVYETYCVNYVPTPVCGTCVDVTIEGPDYCVANTSIATVDIKADAYEDIAAFDLLISYDASALFFIDARSGSEIDEWEYFTYRLGDAGNCEGCPSGIIRLVGIADINNGPHHPGADQYYPSGAIASLSFRVTSDVNFGGHNIPLSFLWLDCGDNSFSNTTGQYLFIDKMVFSREGNIIWDEADDDNYPESDRIDFVGAPDECVQGIKTPPVRCVDFRNGEICIIHPDSIDARGDLNLNGIANEIADAVVYTNFFITGLNAFNISIPGQIAASDVNGDGVPLTIADLVLLVRIISGDVQPIPKISTEEATLGIMHTQAGNTAKVSVSSRMPIGAALLVFNYDGPDAGKITLGEAAENMSIRHLWTDTELRILIYSFESEQMIQAGEFDLLEIIVPEGGKLELVELEAAEYYGRTLAASITNRALPTQLLLSQNYPNPFNPTTTFVLSLPVASEYRVSIYNIMGQSIRTWTGHSEAGEITFEWDGTDDSGSKIASGIYLYKAQAAGSEAIRKMVLLK